MEVKEFVKTILNDVSEAVDESNNERAGFHFLNSSSEGIDFDLAVILKKNGESNAKVKVIIAEGELKGKISQEIINRIKFRVHPYIKDWNKKKK